MAKVEGKQIDTLPSQIYGKTGAGVIKPVLVGEDGSILKGMDIPEHDYIGMSYTSTDLTGVTYKSGGSGGTTVATLTLAYTSNVLQSVTLT